ncbi:MAG TPA: SelB C-terminal domain-containing protein, partial [Burkholderiales bacterium]|nr:SelB C-terminal domain-containing protein [Burkholderiales bacterium]
LRTMETGNDREALERLLRENPLGIDLSRFLANRNLSTLPEVPMRAAGGIGFSPEHWKALRERALATIGAFHARSPESGGLAEDRIVEGTRLPRKALIELAEELAREGGIVRDGASVRLAGHRAQLAPADAALWERVAPILAEGSLRPPTLTELGAALGKDAKHLEPVLARLARHGLLVRVSKNRFFTPEAVKRLEDMAKAEAKERGTITAAAFRDRAGIGRNLTIEVLEYFDRTKFTRRAGDAHVLVR